LIKVLVFIFIAELWNAAGHVCFTKGTNNLALEPLRSFNGAAAFFGKVIRQKMIWAGILALTIGLVVWIMALSNGELSYVYPIGSFQYVMIMIAARMFLNEKIDWMKLLGTLLVVAGIIVIAVS